MSSLPTSSPVSASTFMYLMRWPVLRLIWLKETFSVSEVAGYSATGQVTSDSRRKPFQLARGAMANSGTQQRRKPEDNIEGAPFKQAGPRISPTALTVSGLRVFRRFGQGRTGTSAPIGRFPEYARPRGLANF